MIRINLDPDSSVVISGAGVKGDVVVTNKGGRLTFKEVDGPNASKPPKPVGDVEFNVGREPPKPVIKDRETRNLRVEDFEDDIGWASKAIRDQFITNLQLVETKRARKHATKGITECKHCPARPGSKRSGQVIGGGSYYSAVDSDGLEVTWPVELAEHFIRKHNCNPPSWFNRFINSLAMRIERKEKIEKNVSAKKPKTKNITKMKPKKAKDLSR